MKPIGAIKRGEEYSVIQQCQKCGFERKNKMLPEDNFEALVEIARQNAR